MIVSMIEFGKDFVVAAFDGRCVLIVAARQSGTFLIFARWADRDHAFGMAARRRSLSTFISGAVA